jgi:hypothetical protein
MKLEAALTFLLLFGVAIALCLSAGGATRFANADGYSHGTQACLQGRDGQGIRLRLREHRHCEGQVTYPYLELDIRDLPIAANQSITIGEDNLAFICQKPEKSCQQFRSGEIMFNHFEQTSAKGIQTDGWYQLKSGNDRPETGRFNVDCIEPCG